MVIVREKGGRHADRVIWRILLEASEYCVVFLGSPSLLEGSIGSQVRLVVDLCRQVTECD